MVFLGLSVSCFWAKTRCRLPLNGTAFRSDVRLANVTSSPVTSTLIFTPSGADGRTEFAAVEVSLAPGRSAAG